MEKKSTPDQKLNRRSALGMGVALAGASLVPITAYAAVSETGPFDVKKFGATGKKSDNATKAFRDAIESCTHAGGGVVSVPPGEYTVGTIQLLDNVTLHIEAGATLFLSQQQADFVKDSESMIYAQGAKNISVTGKGVINGLARYDFTAMDGVDGEIIKEIEIARKAGIDMRRYYRSESAMNVFLFVLNDCSNVTITDVSIINSPLWTVRINDCDRVHIRGIYIFSDLEKGVNADGIDICSSRNVIISDSIITTGDDSIVLKAIARNGKKANPVENITVTNCVLTSSSTPLMIGTETEADFRHILFNNCVIRNSNKGFGINVQDGATVSDVIFSNLTVETNRRHWNWWGDAEMCKFILRKRTDASPLGKIRDIFIDNIIVKQRGTSTITGDPAQLIENIRMSNIHLRMEPEDAKDKRATNAIKIENVAKLKIKDLTIDWNIEKPETGWQNGLVLNNVSDFMIDSFAGRQGASGSGSSAIVLENTSDGTIHNSAATDGTSIFVHIKGNKTKDLTIRGNSLRKATKDVTFENEELKKDVRLGG